MDEMHFISKRKQRAECLQELKQKPSPKVARLFNSLIIL